MNVTISPSKANGIIKVQPSKSMAHRLILAAALAKGKSVISNVVLSDDIKATLSGIEAFGAKYSVSEEKIEIVSDGFYPVKNGEIDCNESGSTLRFLIPQAMTAGVPITFSGKARLMERPLSEYEKICADENIRFEKKDGKITVCGELGKDSYTVRGDVSSQYITGLLFAFPKLKQDTVLTVSEPIESRPYIDMTLEILDLAKIKYSVSGNSVKIFGGQKFSPVNTSVEGDFSNAAFPAAFGLVGGNVTLTGLPEKTAQGDAVYREYFRELNNSAPTLDVKNCPDLAPILMAVAALKNGATLENTARLKFKESDRGSAMKEELEKFGATVITEENRITVKKSELHFPNAILSSHNDHRIAMALSVVCSVTGGKIAGAEAVAKSYPGYWKEIEKLGIEVQYE